jgi:ATP-dependent Lhr-like helicase
MVSWPGDSGEINTKILERMKRVLEEDVVYPYLMPNAKERINVARRVARNTGMLEKPIVSLGGYTRCIFPWLGTRSFRTLRKFIQQNSREFGISGIEFEGCYYITFKMERDNYETLISELNNIIKVNGGIDCHGLVASSEIPIFDKYDPYIPSTLLRRAYAADRLRADEVEERISQMSENY